MTSNAIGELTEAERERAVERFVGGPIYAKIRGTFAEERLNIMIGLEKAAAREIEKRDAREAAVEEAAERIAVLSALRDRRYKWRTVQGIADELQVDQASVRRVFEQCRDEVVRCPRLSMDGQELFTARSHFIGRSSPWERLLGALRMRLV